jgi:hypothetical protein
MGDGALLIPVTGALGKEQARLAWRPEPGRGRGRAAYWWEICGKLGLEPKGFVSEGELIWTFWQCAAFGE